MKTKKSKKGFTLMELIIVIAIMGILMAIIIPSWGYFIRRARERSANAKAKVVFNAAQTEVTRMGAKERPLNNIVHNPASDSVLVDKTKKEIYMGDYDLKDRKKADDSSNRTYYDFYFYWDGETGCRVDDKGTKQAVTGDDTRFARAINSITGGDGSYKIYVRNYNVMSVVYSDYENGNYKGTYPVGMDELSSSDRDSIRENSVIKAAMDKMVLK